MPRPASLPDDHILRHVSGRYFFSTPINDFFKPARDKKITRFIKVAQITCSEPSVSKGRFISLQVIFIAGRNIIATYCDFPEPW